MKIRIMEVASSASCAPLVTFKTAIGIATARWGGSTIPVPGDEVHVELDVPPLGAGTLLQKVPPSAGPRLMMESRSCRIRGTVESVDDDGIAFLRLSSDCLMMVEIGDALVGEQVELIVRPDAFVITACGY